MSQYFSRLILNWSGRAGYHRSNPSALALWWQCMAPAAAPNTEVRRHLLKPEFKSRLRPLSFWQVVFLSPHQPMALGIFLTHPPLHSPLWSWSQRDRRKMWGQLRKVFCVSLHLGISQKTGSGFPCRANWASRQQDTELGMGCKPFPATAVSNTSSNPGCLSDLLRKTSSDRNHLSRQPVPAPLCSHCLLERFSYHYPESFQL